MLIAWGLWCALALVWLLAMPHKAQARPLDFAYPLLPCAVGALAWLALPAFPAPARALLDAWGREGLLLWAMLTVVWGISLARRDASIMDIAYGYVLLFAPWWLWQQLGADTSGRSLLLLALASLGFGRYAVYVTWRNLPHGEDPRYARWRERGGARWWWWSYFQIFLLQAVVIWVWSLPLVLALLTPGPLGPLQWLAAAVWLTGFAFEAGGDWQLARFKRQRASREQLLDSGLWRLTRHPNYFGQTCMWWAYTLLAQAHPLGWLALPIAAYITWFMYTGSATSLMERYLLKTKPAYAAYCARVNAFFPGRPRRTQGTP